MKTWKLNEAQSRLIELLQSCIQEPQIVCDQDKPLAVVVDITLFKELMELRQGQHRPTISELLDELSDIKRYESVDIEIPGRQDRSNPMIEVTNEVSM